MHDCVLVFSWLARPKMHWWERSCFSIKSCGLGELAFIRYDLSLSTSCFIFSASNLCDESWLGCLICCLVAQDAERLNLISRISLFCWMAGTACTALAEVSCLSEHLMTLWNLTTESNVIRFRNSYLRNFPHVLLKQVIGILCCRFLFGRLVSISIVHLFMLLYVRIRKAKHVSRWYFTSVRCVFRTWKNCARMMDAPLLIYERLLASDRRNHSFGDNFK